MARIATLWLGVLITAMGGLTWSSGKVQGQEFYKGKTMTFVVGFGVGGSYDRYSRLVAGNIGRQLPGTPTLVVQNMPGAGSVLATNHLYAIAPQDGTVIGMVDQSIQAFELIGRKGLRAEVAKFNWLGRLVSNSAVLFAWHNAPIKKIEDALTTELIVSASGSASRLNWTVLNNVVGTKLKIISGYRSSEEAVLAMQRGEIHGLSRPWPGIKSTMQEWLKEGKIRLLLQTGAQRNAELPDVPRMLDLAKNEADRQVLSFFASPSEIGRSVVAPPGVPADRVALLRDAFWKMINDPAFKEDVTRTQLDLEPLRGDDLQKLVAASRNVPRELVDRANALAASASKSE